MENVIIEIIDINKIDFKGINSKRKLYLFSILTLITCMGGLKNVMIKLREMQDEDKITKKQAFDLRQAIKEAIRSYYKAN